jgi:hypothetical protein
MDRLDDSGSADADPPLPMWPPSHPTEAETRVTFETISGPAADGVVEVDPGCDFLWTKDAIDWDSLSE